MLGGSCLVSFLVQVRLDDGLPTAKPNFSDFKLSNQLSSRSGVAAQYFKAGEMDTNGRDQGDTQAMFDLSPSCSEFHSDRIESMISSKSDFDTELGFRIAHSKVHWSELSHDDDASGSAKSFVDHRPYFEELQKDARWGGFCSKVVDVVLGEKLGEGAQADIYEAEVTFADAYRPNKCGHVVKVMKADCALQDLQQQWPLGMARFWRSLWSSPLLGVLVKDKVTQNSRFGFVMKREWGDLRALIDMRMERNPARGPPFGVPQAKWMMFSIVHGMRLLHRYGIIHRDLKASNVLVSKPKEGDLVSEVSLVNVQVADWECSVGVVGSGFWRAPEILQQLKDRIPGSEVKFTMKADVYSCAMTCYEIMTGLVPFEGHYNIVEMRDAILNGTRPELPHGMDPAIKEVITSCWHSSPSQRPSFEELEIIICERWA